MSIDKKIIDWEKIEFDYRAGILSLREIAVSHGITEGAIRKRAKRDSWDRDLTAKIKSKAESLVRREMVRNEVRNSDAYQTTEKAIVEANANMQANVRVEHRKDIQRSRKIVMTLLTELELQTDNIELLQRLSELMHSPDEKAADKLNDVYQKVISLGSRSTTMKSLAESLKTLVTLERQAFGIDGYDANDDDRNIKFRVSFA